ncbi:glycosyltransferase family 4 protein [Marinobacter sp. LN3S78]|uniref:glycosyltransferase family 4 protein n=1 Tax=Marinobacter sp. LN3S78 TaxID=3382300 RepID=UPI00387B4C4C
MKIFYVISRSDEVGGAHVHVRDMAVWMGQQGHEVKVLVGGNGLYIDWLNEAEVNVLPIYGLGRNISVIKDLVAFIHLLFVFVRYKPDLISIHSAKAGVLARIAAFFSRTTCIFTAHGWSFTDGVGKHKSKIYAFIERILEKISNLVITVCESDKELALERGIGTDRTIVAVHNGMPNLPYVEPRQNKIVRFIMIARFEEQKDHRSLIYALSGLEKDLPWTLTLVGSGPLQPNIESLAKKLNISDRVEFLGRRKDVPELLSGSDVFVLSTNWEGFPRSILEAMRAGLPVLASDVAGIPEAVKDGVNGFLIPKGDAEYLRSRLRCTILDPSLRSKMGKEGRRLFESNFTFERMASQTLVQYQRLLQ